MPAANFDTHQHKLSSLAIQIMHKLQESISYVESIIYKISYNNSNIIMINF
jgi:hypothetical protein